MHVVERIISNVCDTIVYNSCTSSVKKFQATKGRFHLLGMNSPRDARKLHDWVEN